MVSLFGGTPGVSHFTANVKYKVGDESYREQRDRRKAQFDALKALGFKQQYFQFRDKDEEGKKRAKAQAEAHAKEWAAKAGFELEVCEGCFL
jgi:Holliday junction resolvasome RuvABC DNA-binding subunit